MKYGIKYVQKAFFPDSVKTNRGYEAWIKADQFIVSDKPALVFENLNAAFIAKQNRYDTNNYYFIVEEFTE